MKSKIILLAILFISCNFSKSVQSENVKPESPGIRNINWAEKIEADASELPNFYKVSDVLYRGAQPTENGVKKLKELGIKTIINLRSFNSDRDEIGKTDLNYIHLYVKAWHIEKKEIIKFLETVSDTSLTPVFVHCQHGADRTGAMCAIYRIVKQNWSKKEAIDEMVNGGYGYHKIW
nr:dual specificity protein phosphatase family protein [bacterium]